MKKLLALVLTCALALLCACSAADPAQIAAAKESGLAGTWYANAMGTTFTLTLKEDLSCAMMTIENDTFSYKGTWKVSGSDLTLSLKAISKANGSAASMDDLHFSHRDGILVDKASGLNFRREQPISNTESAPERDSVTLSDFEGIWEVYLIRLNGVMLEMNGEPIPPSEFGADMTVSIGTDSAAVDLGAYSDGSLSFMEFAISMTNADSENPAAPYNTTYIFSLNLVNNTLTMTLDPMEMYAQLHTDGTMSISGRTPLHGIAFTEDAPLIVYLQKVEPTEESAPTDDGRVG